MSAASKNIQNDSFMLTSTHPIGCMLLVKLVQFVYSTHSARLFIVRNIQIIFILQ